MNEYFQESTSHKVKYKNLKNEMEDQHATEIFIPPRNDEKGRSKIVEGRISLLKALISIFAFIITFFVTSCAVYYYTTNSNSDSSCKPLNSITRVVVSNTISSNHSCSDNQTCHSLLGRIEKEFGGRKYNFIIGSKNELYVGLGFKCLVNSKENSLYIHVLKSDNSVDEYLKKCFRISELIDHGLLCGKIAKNYSTVIHNNESETTSIDNNICHALYPETPRSHHFHDPDHEIGTLIHSDFRWTVCGNFSHATKMKKGKVITLESLPEKTCLPLKPVDEIIVDVVKTSLPSRCSNDSSCVDIFKEHHDGFKYNFIIGLDYDVFVGLGFRCSANKSSDRMLKIKVLKPQNSEFVVRWVEFRKLAQILKEGITCGKIRYGFSVKATCNTTDIRSKSTCEERYEFLGHTSTLEYYFSSVFDIYSEEHYNITDESDGGLVPSRFRYKACHKEHHESSTHADETTTFSHTTPTSVGTTTVQNTTPTSVGTTTVQHTTPTSVGTTTVQHTTPTSVGTTTVQHTTPTSVGTTTVESTISEQPDYDYTSSDEYAIYEYR